MKAGDVPPLMARPKPLASPEKEVRFTRAAQGRLFLLMAAVLLALALGLWALATQGTEFEAPRLQGKAWLVLLPLPLALLLIRWAMRCVRHAYLIFSPLGLEIFPLFRPERSMQLLLWTSIDEIEWDERGRCLRIHFNAEKTAGVIVSLAPILPAQRELLRVLVNSLRQQRSSLSSESS